MITTTRVLTAITILLAAQTAYAAPASFMGLGDLPGGIFFSEAFGISDDGSTVVGRARSGSNNEAFRWTFEGGIIGLGNLSATGSFAEDVSADGSTIVGQDSEAFRWTSGSGMVGLGSLPGGISSSARGVSADGSVVVGLSGSASTTVFEAFRWTSAGGMVGLGDLPGGIFSSYASDVSADGSVVVGRGVSTSGHEAFRWTSGSGMVGLGDLPGGSFSSSATEVSNDGSTVVGIGNSASGQEAFRWTSDAGMVGLGDLPGGNFSSLAWGVSADGSTVVGQGRSALGNEAFLWDDANGMRSLQDVLVLDLGLDLTGWTLEEARGISADGRTIVGNGINPDGLSEAWVAYVPEPATMIEVAIPSIGDSFNDGSFAFDDLDGVSLDGQTLNLELVFDDLKALAYQPDTSDTSLIVRVGFDVGFETGLQNPSVAILNDQFGNAITPAPDYINVSTDAAGILYYQMGFHTSLFVLDDKAFRGANFELTLPDIGGTINSSSLEFILTGNGELQVVPEPSTAALAVLGATMLVLVRRTRRHAGTL